MKKFFCFLSCLMFCLTLTAQSGTDPVNVTDLLKIKTVGNINLTKDGNKAAFTVTSIEPLENTKLDYKYVTQLYTVITDGSSVPVQLTYSKDRATQPVWSPDGNQLAFVRTIDGKPQIFILSMKGGEPWQLTKFTYGASNPKWSPDGKKILFSAAIPFKELLKDSLLNPSKTLPGWSFEKPGFAKNEFLSSGKIKADPDGNIEEVRAYLENNVADNKARVINKLNFQDEASISTDMDFNHFFIVTVQPDDKPREITHGFFRYTSIDFTPDGKEVVFSAFLDSLQHPDRMQESRIFIGDTSGTNFRLLLGQKALTYTNPKVSPSGKWISFLYGSTSFVNVPTLAFIPLNGNSKDINNIFFDRAAGNIVWSNDEKHLYFSAQSNGGAPVYRADVISKKVERLSDYDSGITSFDITQNKIVFANTAVADPSELFVAQGNMKNAKQVSSFNDWVKNRKLSFPEKHTFTNEKGMSVEYWVMKPANYEAGKKYPLLLNIHGGPSSMWGPGEATMWHEFQFFCSKGYGVVYSNPRGSGGYGPEFLKGNVKDWGTGPTSDVLTALDKTVAEGWADTSKLLITGGSYAGYLVAWIIAHDNRFKAACSQRGVYDLATFFGEGNAWRLVPNYFGGYPWEPQVKQVLDRESPINYVQNIRTPYIIFHGDNDRRTGFVQSEMLYRSLKVLGRPVEYVRHQNGTHELTRSGDNRQRIDQMLRTYEFFERWIRSNGQ